MIEVFETWFNQFTKAEQDKLIKYILKNHAVGSQDYAINYPEKMDKKKDVITSYKRSSIRNVKSMI